jgi:hypothetical protein
MDALRFIGGGVLRSAASDGRISMILIEFCGPEPDGFNAIEPFSFNRFRQSGGTVLQAGILFPQQ